MSGVEYTLKKVSEEALNEALASLAEGKVDSEKIITQRLEQVSIEVQRISEQQQRQADALRRQIIGTAEMSARNKSLEIVEDNLNSAFAQASKRLESSATGASYEKVLKGLVSEAVEQVEGSEFTIQGNMKDQMALKKIADQLSKDKKIKIAVDSEAIKTIGGVKVRSSDGYVMFDNTFEARLERLKPTLRKQIAQLFSESK